MTSEWVEALQFPESKPFNTMSGFGQAKFVRRNAKDLAGMFKYV